MARTVRRTSGLQSSDPGLNGCSVSSAHSSADSSHSLKGVGSSTSQVVLETSDCGTLVQSWGVSRDNEDELARDVIEGERYRLNAGEGSFTMRAFLNTIRQAVYVKSFEPVRTR